MLLLLLACAQDPCNAACAELSRALRRCMTDEGWALSWEDLGAESRRDFKSNCVDEVDLMRADLETRQTDEVDDACETTADQVQGLSCEELRALYID